MPHIGIVCEVNPLHGGHRYLLDCARTLAGEEGRIVCVMSGNTVQRGELAIAERRVRAEALVACGADLVLELPAPWSFSSAEGFAGGAIAILKHFCDGVIFGSECGDLSLLQRAASVSTEEEFLAALREALSSGEGAAKAYYRLLEQRLGVGFSSNDLLGIEYLRAIILQKAGLSAHTVKRVGSAYLSEEVTEGGYPSATAIRRLWNTDREAALALTDPLAEQVYRRGGEEGLLLNPLRRDAAVLGALRLMDPEEREAQIGDNSGVIRRLLREAQQAVTVEELITRCATKRYTDGRLRRTLLNCLFGVSGDGRDALPEYTRLLGASEGGRELLARNRRTEGFLVVTKAADAPEDSPQTLLNSRVDAFYYGLLERPLSLAEGMAILPYLPTVGESRKNRS